MCVLSSLRRARDVIHVKKDYLLCFVIQTNIREENQIMKRFHFHLIMLTQWVKIVLKKFHN